MRYPNDRFYLTSPEEMQSLFADLPQALTSSMEIAERCNADFGTHELRLPAFPTPPGETADEMLRRLCEQRLEARYPDADAAIAQRLDYELEVITNMGFAPYFLVVSDFVDFARAQDIAVGPGRGSAAGSLVAYVLGITDVDPIRYGLIFERFLNPERVTMPDMDIDFDYLRRGEVIDYVAARYGADRVSQIITFGTMAARAALRDMGRVLEIPYAKVDRLAKLVPPAIGITLHDALSLEPRLAQEIEQDPALQELWQSAVRVEGMPRHASVHAAGVVISRDPLTEHVPLQRMSDGSVVTQVSMTGLEQLGLLKMDFLGLRTLTVLAEAGRLIRRREPAFSLSAIPEDDAATYALLTRGDTVGVFQMESQGMRELLRDLEPSSLEDLMAANALFRPGPMENIPQFIRNKRSGAVTAPHPSIKEILRGTYGILVYQEQVMMVAQQMAGYTLGEADMLRRAVGKKKREALEAERERFLHGCAVRGHSAAVAEDVFELILRFANYGFNRSHAAAYGILSYRTAYLKANYPVEFYAADMGTLQDGSRVALRVQEARRRGIEVRGPDIALSEVRVSALDGCIQLGLQSVRGVGEAMATAILAERMKRPFASLDDALRRLRPLGLSEKMAQTLIEAGAFDIWGPNRATLLEELDAAFARTQHGQQATLFEAVDEIREVPPWPLAERLRREKEALSFYLSGHPLDAQSVGARATGVLSVAEALDLEDGASVRLYVLRVGERRTRTRAGETMAFWRLEDASAEIEAVLFPRVFRIAPSGDGPFALRGKIQRRDDAEGTPTLLVESFAEVQAEARLYLVGESASPPADVQARLGDSPGDVIVVWARRGARTGHRLRTRVDASEDLLQSLKTALGEANVKFEEQREAARHG